MINLMAETVSRPVYIRYEKAFTYFAAWCKEEHLRPTFESLDSILRDYFELRCDENPKAGERTNCTYVRNYIRLHYPEMLLPISNKALTGWVRLTPAKITNPLPHAIALLMARYFMVHGRLDFATYTLIGFDCYLRTASEFLKISLQDVTLPGEAFTATGMQRGCLRFRVAKTGIEQSVLLRDVVGTELLIRLKRQRKRSGHKWLFDFTATTYNTAFHCFLDLVGLTHLGFRVYSLRHGGATHDYCQDTPITDVQSRGRWRRLQTVERYVNVGRTLAYSIRFPPRITKMLHCLIKDNTLVYRKLKTSLV